MVRHMRPAHYRTPDFHDRRNLALMIDGEPNASDDPEQLARLGTAAECFPEPLKFGVPDGDGRIDWSARTQR
jgi:hypothetical protein